MNSIAFVDTEIDHKGKIVDVGCTLIDNAILHSAAGNLLIDFIKGIKFICGHNILRHDIKYLGLLLNDAGILREDVIDTLPLSPLLFPSRPYHNLVKDDKLQYDESNNPLNDAKKAKDLFFDEVASFNELEAVLKDIYYLLLGNNAMFRGFFRYLGYVPTDINTEKLIRERFDENLCANAPISQMINERPVELAYSLSLISANDRYSITPPWVLMNHPAVEKIIFQLRNKPCLGGCGYCNQALDARLGLKKYFGHNSFRSYAGEPLQQNAVEAAIHGRSILAVFPTGGGKSITFQVPALISGEYAKSLTVVISPLQSLMKDQVDNLEKAGITDAVTINGSLDPIERAKSLERVENGSASILYISPELLRSKTIERVILGRKIARFVVDEAHCFSAWGQNFRVDYLYIADFIRSIQEKKNLDEAIPVSCFTATAKQKVIEDICEYFFEKLNLKLEVITSNATRTNLHYQVFAKEDDDEKYLAARDLVTEKNCPAIIYVSRTKRATKIAARLTDDGINARAYHGKMEPAQKTANQNAFLSGEVDVMVATSAFGMGVDKKDVGVVIHYDISDSLENYVQEAGRAGRDENIKADCYVLYNEEDLSKHFIMHNQTKLSIKEIQQVWSAIKGLTSFRSTMSHSALEIARKAGWDDSVGEIETRVTTAIAALEESGYLKRGQNSPRIYANSILSQNAQQAIDKINTSPKFSEKQKEQAVRIIKKLFSSRSRKLNTSGDGESRVDYISDHLGIVKEDVITVINLLRDEKILADRQDLTAFIKSGDNKNQSYNILEAHAAIENQLFPLIDDQLRIFNLKDLNERLEQKNCTGVSPNKIKTIFNFWDIKQWIKRKLSERSKDHFKVAWKSGADVVKEQIEKRHQLARHVVDHLFQRATSTGEVEFSVVELKEAYENKAELYKYAIGVEDIEDTLLYLSKIEAIKIDGGFLVAYNRLTIERTELDNKRRYKLDDYQKLELFYANKIQQIHIVGEYAKKMIHDYREALQFVEDYFQLNYTSFLNKYFKGRQKEISQNITPAKFQQIFGQLSPTQLNIVKDDNSKCAVVAAGPGSGKTKVLVHKLASLLLMEDVKHEQLLMLTFSRAAATEFKKRLIDLIHGAAHYIEIKTFHSYCFDLLGKVGNLDSSDSIVKTTVARIREGDVEVSRITKTVLVIDEAQDMDADEFALVKALMDKNEDMRVIAVGDDDQNIYEFRGANSKYLQQLLQTNGSVKYELVENYRSKANLVDMANQFAKGITNRLKSTPIIANQPGNGKIKIVRYQHNHLIVPLVDDLVATPLTGSTCVLVKTNEEALQITCLLLKYGLPAKLIQANDGFSLFNLVEIRRFLELLGKNDQSRVITDVVWDTAVTKLKTSFQRSQNWEICENLIKEFHLVNPKIKYRSDLDAFIRESKLEDFYTRRTETIFVSTIHKAKGREYDNVYLLLEDFIAETDEKKRQLYVALTRAKQNLIIHTNTHQFNNIHTAAMERIENHDAFSEPDELIMQLTHKDIWLDHFYRTQDHSSQLMAGDKLIIEGDECVNTQNKPILKFSTGFTKEIEKLATRGYHPKSALVNFMVYWHKENTDKEIMIVLPQISFSRPA